MSGHTFALVESCTEKSPPRRSALCFSWRLPGLQTIFPSLSTSGLGRRDGRLQQHNLGQQRPAQLAPCAQQQHQESP